MKNRTYYRINLSLLAIIFLLSLLIVQAQTNISEASNLPQSKYSLEGEFLKSNNHDGEKLGHISNLNPQQIFQKLNSDSVSIVDSVIGTYSDGDTFKQLFSYDSNGQWTMILLEEWDGSLTREIFSRNSKGELILRLIEKWEDNQWNNDVRFLYTYAVDGSETLRVKENWDGSQWSISWQIFFTYDSNGNIVLMLNEEWDGSQWIKDWQNSYTYDSNGNEILRQNEDWDGSQWIKDWQNSYTYDFNGNNTSELSEEWNSGQWETTDRYTNIYNSNGNRLSELAEIWDNGNWVTYWHIIYEYDSDGNMNYAFSEDWVNGNWEVSDGPFNFEVTSGQNYSYYSSEIRVYYSNLTITNVAGEAVTSEYLLSQNYPNPFNPTTTIEYSIPKQSFVILKVYNILGVEVANLVNKYQQSGSYKLFFDASNTLTNREPLVSGIYFIKLRAGEFLQIRKIILMK